VDREVGATLPDDPYDDIVARGKFGADSSSRDSRAKNPQRRSITLFAKLLFGLIE
jgi:hypothetical protein